MSRVFGTPVLEFLDMNYKHVEIIAEVGSVHDGSFGNAKCLIDAAECALDTAFDLALGE